MVGRERAGRSQRYCPNCRAEVRTGNAFCVSCGKQLNVEGAARPVVRDAGSSNRSLLNQRNIMVALYGAGVLLFLIVFYLLFNYSVPLGFLLIGLSVLAVLVIRKNRGRQTRLERRVFERAGRYGDSARRAYEEGKHREFARNAYRQSREAYEGATVRYRDRSENRVAGDDRQPKPNTGNPSQGALQGVSQNLLRRIKGLPIVLKVAGAVVAALLLLTVLSPIGLVVALLLLGVSVAALIVRARQRRSVKEWGIVAVASLVLALVFGGVSSALYDAGLSGNFGSASTESVRAGQEDAKEPKGKLYDGGSSSRTKSTSPEGYEEPIDIYLVKDPIRVGDGVAILGPGHLLVKRKERRFFAFANGFEYESGKVGPNGSLISEGWVPGYTIGNLNRLDYACTYDAADTDGGRATAQEACGFL